MTSPRMTHPLAEVDYPHQCRDWEETAYTRALGDALEALFDAGRHELAEIVDGLNQSGVLPPGRSAWTEELFRAEMARLGA